MPKLTQAQILLGKHLRELKLRPTFEHRFCERRWRADIALLEQGILIELDGMYAGRHRGWGGDYDKQNYATLLGWRLLRFCNRDVMNGKAKDFIAQFLREPNRNPAKEAAGEHL